MKLNRDDKQKNRVNMQREVGLETERNLNVKSTKQNVPQKSKKAVNLIVK